MNKDFDRKKRDQVKKKVGRRVTNEKQCLYKVHICIFCSPHFNHN